MANHTLPAGNVATRSTQSAKGVSLIDEEITLADDLPQQISNDLTSCLNILTLSLLNLTLNLIDAWPNSSAITGQPFPIGAGMAINPAWTLAVKAVVVASQ